MPLYTIDCKDCGINFERILKWDEDSKCPECQSEKTKKRMGAFTFKFVGYPSFVDRIDDHQKRQVDRGEQPTLPHPSQVM